VFPLNYYLYLIGLGIFIGLLGVAFNATLIKTIDGYKKVPVATVFRPLIPIAIAFGLGLYLPQTLGAGHQLIDLLQGQHFALTMLIVLLVVKFLFTMISYGSGVPGGIFLPLLVIGAIAGTIFGSIAVQHLNISIEFANNFIVLAMAALFTAVFKAPITGSILITEMTGSFSHLYAMITVSLTAYIVTDLLNSKSIYEELMKRIVGQEKDQSTSLGDEKVKVIIESPVALGSELDSKKIKDIQWPENCLLVGIKRGEREIIPRGSTAIQAGDYLVILTNEDQEYSTQTTIARMSS
ncbi:MAG: chloride channel protein, partial [Bacillota bacterium]|nr:chloride channel protein [Bacillota bacterium]